MPAAPDIAIEEPRTFVDGVFSVSIRERNLEFGPAPDESELQSIEMTANEYFDKYLKGKATYRVSLMDVKAGKRKDLESPTFLRCDKDARTSSLAQVIAAAGMLMMSRYQQTH